MNCKMSFWYIMDLVLFQEMYFYKSETYFSDATFISTYSFCRVFTSEKPFCEKNSEYCFYLSLVAF